MRFSILLCCNALCGNVKHARNMSYASGNSINGSKANIPENGTKSENKQFDIPKPYLSESVTSSRSRRTRQINTVRVLTQWKNDRESGKKWSCVWTAPAPFDPHKVPLDIRMGAAQNMIPQPFKYGNLELMKTQNFLHLTPPAIKAHCNELKKFCTEWPEELANDENCEKEFPIEIHTTDYIHAAQSQQNCKARITTLKVRLCNLALNLHARVKLVKLAADRYDPKTDILTTVADRCPVRKQNREYLDYLLTVLYYEAWKVENWESREFIEDEDGIYWWKDSNSYKSLMQIMASHPKYRSVFEDKEKKNRGTNSFIEDIAEVKALRDAVCKIKMPSQNITDRERRTVMSEYKESVRTLLGLPQL